MSKLILLLAGTEKEYTRWCVVNGYMPWSGTSPHGDRVRWIRSLSALSGIDSGPTTIWDTTGSWYLTPRAHDLYNELRRVHGIPVSDAKDKVD